MSTEHARGQCDTCEEDRRVSREKPNHILHLLLTIFTVGAWVIVWIALAMNPKPWRCDTCGATGIRNIR